MPFPIVAALGAIQTGLGLIKQGRAAHQLQNLQSPKYNQNQSILDYYNKALSKYNVNPYQTDLYRMQEKQADRGLASGLSALQSRGQALAGINNLVQGRSDNLLKAGAMAEQQQQQNLNRVGQAAQLKAGEDKAAFNINEQAPFERKYNLLAMKASGGTNIANAGLTNLFGGLQSDQQMKMLDKYYAPYSSGSSTGGGSINPSNVLRDLYRNQNRRVG